MQAQGCALNSNAVFESDLKKLQLQIMNGRGTYCGLPKICVGQHKLDDINVIEIGK